MRVATTLQNSSPEQEAHAQELAQVLAQALQADLLQMTRLLASQPDHPVLGQAEFQIRDIVHRFGAKAIQAELDARQKKQRPDKRREVREIMKMPQVVF